MCRKKFCAWKGLIYHVKEVHEGVQEHNCDIYGQRFASKATCDDHRRIHTGERPYVCDECGKMFKTEASLYIHKKNHLYLFPFSCSYCHKQFRRKYGLLLQESNHMCVENVSESRVRIKHKTVHSGANPFAQSVASVLVERGS
jgi:KRAB domain-containing zinc finger protein